jgi:hypothetical protein
MSAAAGWISDAVRIPDLLGAAPQVRPVLDRYGLRGCGGPLGPAETLGFFARAHDVPLQQLLDEVRTAAEKPAVAVCSCCRPDAADTIYRPFFKAAIAVVLSLGAVWGAWLLLRIAWTGAFTAAGLHEVNAHGHAQIFGWVGLFVMGFAYQAFPRFKHTTLSHPRLAYATLWLMLAGLVSRCVCEPLAGSPSWTAVAAVAGSAIEVVAIGLFAAIVLLTWQRSGRPLALYDAYILAALGWFVLQAIGEAVYLAATLAAADRQHLLELVRTWQGALREAQIHGFALLMILGVSQRFLPNFYGLPQPSRRLGQVVLVLLNLAIVGECLGLVFMGSRGHTWVGLWYGSALVLAGTVLALVRGMHVFGPAAERDRSLKFIRAAYAWLLASLAMLVLLPLYQRGILTHWAPDSAAAGTGFSHAYYGAVRHAITVGFISLMIVGVSAKVVPTLNGVDVRRLAGLWAPFVLLNTGCALRVLAQTATDFTPRAFPIAGISGVLEVTGLALWGTHLWRVMAGRARLHEASTPAPAVIPGEPILAAHRVGEVLDRYPALLDTFLAFGFTLLANPLLRRTVARLVSIEQACRRQGVDVAKLLAALNQARTAGECRHPLPLVTAH